MILGLFSEFVGEMRVERYEEHATSLNVSPSFLYHKYPDDCLPLTQIILNSFSPERFRRKADILLASHGKTDFYDFSLAMGSFMGVYNIYPYEFLTEDIKKEISVTQVNPQDVQAFLGRHFNNLTEYFYRQYHISSNDVREDIQRMFRVSNDDTIYRSPVCRDIGKILIATTRLFYSIDARAFEENISYLIASGQMVEEFHKMNHTKASSHTIK